MILLYAIYVLIILVNAVLAGWFAGHTDPVRLLWWLWGMATAGLIFGMSLWINRRRRRRIRTLFGMPVIEDPTLAPDEFLLVKPSRINVMRRFHIGGDRGL